MKILVVGGGSGGHITPAIAVVREILAERPRTRIEFWTDRKYYKNVLKLTVLGKTGGDLNMKVKKVCSGKFRRYAGWKLKDYFAAWRVTLVDLIGKNFIGFFGFLAGIIQSAFRLFSKGSRPDVIFLKGGFVGLPVGIVARWFKIPYVIHESDATPGLANRILMKRAEKIAMGARFDTTREVEIEKEDGAKEVKIEPIPGREKWVWTGTPIAEEFRKVTDSREGSLKKSFGYCTNKPLVVITGGSQGALHINEAVKVILPELLKFAEVGLVAGRKHYEEMTELKKYEEWEDAELKSGFRMWEFNSNMAELLGAADIVVSRAGATTIAELASLSKAVILVPFAELPGAHQTKNAEYLAGIGAARCIDDAEMVKHPKKLLEMIRELAHKPSERAKLAAALHEEAKLDSAKKLAEIVVEVGMKDLKSSSMKVESEHAGR
ncbi:UDP-N-acetylglucosamine--N-acetylmuramyl-(pentapeptide) pyrophosphoryl-undecaprenol N-acetylglucosamine transferase [Candidatus Saccharibacteria bacterium]|nr:UDP-N-acetylglucosamine--N-acetylmuramyl-(pentapeptide) pyrophosphoryl-undecaprenol N-acetylglucosamine transferase [Candidatus Saccharibacteria bacterium]